MEKIKQAKIIKENGKQKIEFAKDSFGPYKSVFSRTDCYYSDLLFDRGSVLFPYKNKEFNNTEIFLETDDIVVCPSERTKISGEVKTFIDIINLKTEKKQRLYVDEVNLIYNGENEIVINANFDGVWNTVKLDNETMQIKEEKEEKLLAFFKVLYNEIGKKWYRLDYVKGGYYNLLEIDKYVNTIKNFDRKNLKLNYELSGNYYTVLINMYEKINSNMPQTEKDFIRKNKLYNNDNFINSQNYLIGNKIIHKVLINYYGIQIYFFSILIKFIIILTLILLIIYFFIVTEILFLLIFYILFFITVWKKFNINNNLNKYIVFREKFSDEIDLNNFSVIKKNNF